MRITALAGGVGGAKLAHGFSKIMAADDFVVVVNTGDDFQHYGLEISPDLDTVCYMLAEISNPKTGWGRSNETFETFEVLKDFGGPDWFLLGDKDLALNLERTRLLQTGMSLTEVTNEIRKKFGIQHEILPMSDENVRTIVDTQLYGEISFQEYFVKYKFQPKVKSFRFQGIENAKPSDRVINSLINSDLVVLCPSNPFVSINPILSLPGVRDLLCKKFVIGVSPILGGKAVKGPLGKILSEFEMSINPSSIVDLYKDFLNVFLIDNSDTDENFSESASSIIIKKEDILIPNINTRIKLAKAIISIYNK